MAQKIQSIRGMNDMLPQDAPLWEYLENTVKRIAKSYGYQEIRTPMLEMTELFSRSIGEVTDIVEKEMYTFMDREKRSVTLRPEGTASVVRAGIEHSLFYNQVQRLWYLGPTFRHERPQKGRYRQFYQFGAEAFGMAGAEIDAEMIAMTKRFWDELGISDKITLQVNNIGKAESRNLYREKLIEYFTRCQDQLDDDSKRRLHSNPLRILDSKNPAMQTLIEEAPVLQDYLSMDSKEHWGRLLKLLKKNQIPYEINLRLVRGLDYYTDTVFEWVTNEKGAQNTVLAGGRYDKLVEQLGGQPTPAVGFAMGCERVLELILQKGLYKNNAADIYVITLDENSREFGFQIAEALHQALPHQTITTDWQGGSVKNQFKRADKTRAKLALVIGENEVNTNTITIKYLREDKPQEIVEKNKLTAYLQTFFQVNQGA